MLDIAAGLLTVASVHVTQIFQMWVWIVWLVALI